MPQLNEKQKADLIEAANAAIKNHYNKSPGHIYSAAVLTAKGNIYPATQYFSDTYTLTVHGEHAALIHAAVHGESEILAIAVASNQPQKSGEFINPCHMCKQLLWESHLHSKLPMLIILVNQLNETKEIDLEEMINFPWPPKENE